MLQILENSSEDKSEFIKMHYDDITDQISDLNRDIDMYFKSQIEYNNVIKKIIETLNTKIENDPRISTVMILVYLNILLSALSIWLWITIMVCD